MTSAQSDRPRTETSRYVKSAGKEWVFESEIELQHTSNGLTITSVTGREGSRLKLVSRFDSEARLLDATVTTERRDAKEAATVSVVGGKARVTRHGGDVTELDCPPGVIVTSAPDWTDAVLLVRRYDRGRGGKQEFAGLWIHPSQGPQRLAFVVTRLRGDSVERGGKSVPLDRFQVILRGGSRYVAWSDDAGQLVRLVPEQAPQQGIVLSGWEDVVQLLSLD